VKADQPENSLVLRILFVDDKLDSVQSAMDEVGNRFQPNPSIKHVTFGEAQSSIKRFAPHVVVLDLREDATGDLPTEVGEEKVLNFVWDHRFCPVVIYSAFPDELVDKDKGNHPFVKTVKKGSQSERAVADYASEFVPYIEALESVNAEINNVMNRSLREVSGRIFSAIEPKDERTEHLTRSVRRRVAAKMDEKLSSGNGPKLAAWEHLLCPPVSTQLLTGDILVAKDANADAPESFRVIVSPSCDLVREGNRQPKVTEVLLAKCKPVTRLLGDAGLSADAKPDKVKSAIRPALTQGYSQSCLPLPELKGVFPSMVADFRSLELASLDEIGDGSTTKYRRVASLDNPFRNHVAWAYCQYAARPGLPDRDFEAWTGEIVSQITPKATGDQ
jgi:hypothetical protein